MNKKAYKKPSMKVAQIKNSTLICTSVTGFNLNEDPVDNYDDHDHEVDTRDIWGTQW